MSYNGEKRPFEDEDDRKPAAAPKRRRIDDEAQENGHEPAAEQLRSNIPRAHNTTESAETSPGAAASGSSNGGVAPAQNNGFLDLLADSSDFLRHEHKETMVRSLLQLDRNRVKSLAKICGVDLESRDPPDEESQLPNGQVVSKVPRVVAGVNGHGSTPPSRQAAPRHTLKDVEDETRAWHLARRPGMEADRLRSFVLQYNEVSVYTVAKWVNHIPDMPERDSHYYPTVDVQFRKCSICGNWGHFEMRCQQASREHVLMFAREEQLSKTRKNAAAGHGEVLVEECDGFAIEQRSAESKLQVPANVEVCEMEHITIKAAPNASSFQGRPK